MYGGRRGVGGDHGQLLDRETAARSIAGTVLRRWFGTAGQPERDTSGPGWIGGQEESGAAGESWHFENGAGRCFGKLVHSADAFLKFD
ncbi:hypothetical protein GCM10010273_13390 [Streptomyces lavendulocolor]